MSPFLTDEVSLELSPELSRAREKSHLHKTVVAIGNQVTIATKYVTNVYCHKEALCQMWTQYGLKQTSY